MESRPCRKPTNRDAAARPAGGIALPELFVFGLGYTAGRLADTLRACGWRISSTGSAGNVDFENQEAVSEALLRATHVLSSVPPVREAEDDPVLRRYRSLIETSTAAWVGYLSATGVYGDTNGAWVDESAATGTGRRSARAAADTAWQGLNRSTHIFRLPGIYGPGRSVFDRIRKGTARRIESPGQVFSRIHVDDILKGIVAGMDGPAGIYNLSDDEPAPNSDVVAHGCHLLGAKLPKPIPLGQAELSPMARAFYSENRRVANGKAKRLLGWSPQYATYREGLSAILSEEN